MKKWFVLFIGCIIIAICANYTEITMHYRMNIVIFLSFWLGAIWTWMWNKPFGNAKYTIGDLVTNGFYYYEITARIQLDNNYSYHLKLIDCTRNIEKFNVPECEIRRIN